MTRARFISGGLFWDMFLSYRICWIMGKFGGGKTALGAIMAAKLLAEKRVSQVVSNIPMTFSSNGEGRVPATELKNAAIVLDESWIYLDTRSAVYEYAGFVRKFEHFLILPSVFPIHPRLSFFFVQRIYNGYNLGVPLWVYRWDIANRGVKEHGLFGVWNPTAIFGHYPTVYVAGDDAGISDAVAFTAAAHGYQGLRSDKKNKNKDDDLGLDVLEDTALAVGEAAETLAAVEKKIRRRR